MQTAIQLLIKHLKVADMEYKEENVLECMKEDTEEGKLLNAMLEALSEALKISSNVPVIRRLPTSEEVKRWHQILTGIGEVEMQKDMEATFV